MEDHICGRAQIYLSAHDHSMQWLHQDTTNCSGTELIVNGTGAATTELPAIQPNYYQSLTIGFAYVVIRDRQLTLEFVNTTGTTVFSRTITR
jgi:tartrate-resistant acid phosphatase type 5